MIEDSCNGIIGAKRAGMLAIGYIGGSHCPEGHEQALYDAGADIVFRSYSAMGEYLLGGSNLLSTT